MKEKNKKVKSKKPLFITLAVILVLLVGAIGYGYSMFFGKLNRSKLPQNDAELGIDSSQKAVEDKNVVNIAFFGLDRRNPDAGSRTDSIMVVSIDKDNQTVKAVSLMRDMYVPIPGKEDNRINAAYAFGGPTLAIKTINTNFGLGIRDYVAVDFFGLEKLVNRVGGVKIDVSSAEAKVLNDYLVELNRLNGDSVPNVQAGNRVLNGRQAVAYARIRYVGHGDYERTDRQREVLNQLFKKVKAQGVAKLPGTVSAMMPYVETNLSNTEILGLAMDAAKFNTDSLQQFRLPVDGTFKSQSIRGMSVLVPNIEQNKEKLHEFIYGMN